MDHALVTYVDRQPFSLLLDDAPDQSLATLGACFKVHQFPLVLRVKGPSDGQQVHCLHQGGFTLGIGAEKHHHAARQVQLKVHKIAEVS